MAIRVDMTSPDVDKQLQLLAYYPEILEKHFRPALKETTGDLRDEIRPNIPRDRGKALAAFKARVTGKGLKLQGQVGWWGKTAAWYINIVEHGARAHPINEGTKSRSKSARRKFEEGYAKYGDLGGKGGTHIFVQGKWVTKTTVKGFAGRGFMKAGYAALQGISDQRMTAASLAVLRELSVP